MAISDELERLYASAEAALRYSYAPYSEFRVGAALLTESGRVINAVNVENASLGLTICAERAAVFKAISEGEMRFRAIAIACDPVGACSPCGACRQVLFEFSPAMTVVFRGPTGELVAKILGDLLPDGFSLRRARDTR
jgi:cytidine deaminase